MLFLLSPAKTLDFDTPVPPEQPHSQARLLAQAHSLIQVLQKKSAKQVARLMDLSDKLSSLNVQRYKDWTPEHRGPQARPAMWVFDGDVYDGLQAKTLTPPQWDWAQTHVRILSGLYGLLRPADLIQAHRLEMGTPLKMGRKSHLYAFWGRQIADLLAQDAQAAGASCIVNLASQEYAKAVQTEALPVPVVNCVFQDWQGGQYKVIGLYAKKARGMMLRHAIDTKATSLQDLMSFRQQGYGLDELASNEQCLVFRRQEADKPVPKNQVQQAVNKA